MKKTWPYRIVLCCLNLSLLALGSPVLAQDVCDGVSTTNNTSLVALTVASGIAGEPILVTHPPGDTDRIFIANKNGTIRVKHRGNPATTLFLTIPDVLWASGFGEQGLLGMAFDPDYDTNGFFYVYYTRASDSDQIVSRFTRDTTPPVDPDLADPASQVVLLQMIDSEGNHNGGHLAFGPDGYLYIATGDGGGGNDVHGLCGNGQNRTNLLGKLLRIDPNGVSGNFPDCGVNTSNHRIPASNPFADGPGGRCDEIWAYGLRNPFRFSFDPANGDLYIGDVGQGCWEEIDYAPSTSTGGENYGWRQFEGLHCFDPVEPGCNDIDTASCVGDPGGATPACSDPLPSGDPVPNGTVLPIFDYSHSLGCSVTGGEVYRGCRMNNFQGTYFYSDACAALVRSFVVSGMPPNDTNHLSWMDLGSNNFASFGTDGQGEIYIARLDGVVNLLAPPLPNLEVSGLGAEAFLLNSPDWSWEDLSFTSQHPITSYHVYRADILDDVFNLGEPFNCMFTTTGTSWPGGDPATPPNDTFYAYIVLARNAGGQLTSTGGNPPRTISAVPCP